MAHALKMRRRRLNLRENCANLERRDAQHSQLAPEISTRLTIVQCTCRVIHVTFSDIQKAKRHQEFCNNEHDDAFSLSESYVFLELEVSYPQLIYIYIDRLIFFIVFGFVEMSKCACFDILLKKKVFLM